MNAEILIQAEINKILINPNQPRRYFAEEELQELSESIKTVGILHPPLARPLPNGYYELISGERRWRAAKLAGLCQINLLIRESDATYSAEAALIENIQREDLNPLEIAKALKMLMEKYSLTQEGVAFRVGKKRSTVANYLRLLSLPGSIQTSLMRQELTMGHAKVILSLDTQEKQMILHQRIMKDHLSVKDTEKRAQTLVKRRSEKKSVKMDPHLASLAAQIQEVLGTKVDLKGRGKRGKPGKIMIEYYSLDDLERILSVLGIEI